MSEKEETSNNVDYDDFVEYVLSEEGGEWLFLLVPLLGLVD